MEAALALDWLKFFVAVVFSGVSFMIYRKVDISKEKAMSSFQLNQTKVVGEYKMLLFGNVLMIFTMLVYLYQGLNPGSNAILTGKIFYSTYIAVVAAVLYRWVKRFK